MDTKEKADKKETTIPNPHDAFTKEVLSYKQNGVDFFGGILPQKYQKNLNMRTIRFDPTSYTDEKLKRCFSDVVYSCTSHHGKSTFKLALLFEHKSALSDFPYGQLLRYISRIWDLYKKQKDPIPIVLPIVLYHGGSDWEHRPLYSYLTGDTELYGRFIPEFDYLLVNLREYSDELILQTFGHNPAVKLWLFIQKYIFTPEEVVKTLEKLTKSDRMYVQSEEGLRIWVTTCTYIFAATPIKPEELMRAVNTLPPNAKEAIMTTAQRLRKEGLEQGLEQGLDRAKRQSASRMLEEGLDIELIVRVTGLTREEVEELRQR
jgi:predicted transposase/invertase (TIGR01784 family)